MQAASHLLGPDVLRWVRPPQQERTRRSLGLMLDAAEALVVEKGFDESAIAEIAKRAGGSVGGFYRRFKDKQGLLHALHERFCEEARATADDALDPARWSGAPANEIIASFTAFLVEIYREREGLLRGFLVCGASDETMRARTEVLLDDLADKVGRLLEPRRSELSHPHPAAAAGFGLRVVLGALIQELLLRPGTMSKADERFAEELARVFNGYLGASMAEV